MRVDGVVTLQLSLVCFLVPLFSLLFGDCYEGSGI